MHGHTLSTRREEVALFCDLENVIPLELLHSRRLPDHIRSLCGALTVRLHLDKLKIKPGYGRLYLETQYFHTSTFQALCEKAAAELGLQVFWSPRGMAAERLLEDDVRALWREHPDAFPHTVLILSGDGDLIPLVDWLRHRKCEVCIVSRQDRLNHWFKIVANGTIDLGATLPELTKLSS